MRLKFLQAPPVEVVVGASRYRIDLARMESAYEGGGAVGVFIAGQAGHFLLSRPIPTKEGLEAAWSRGFSANSTPELDKVVAALIAGGLAERLAD